MQHTYLRYECADSFSLTTSSPLGTSQILSLIPSNKKKLLLSCSGSQIHGFPIRNRTFLSESPFCKLSYHEFVHGNIGTGRALNSNSCTCVDSYSGGKVGVGYIDGSIRIYTLDAREEGLGVVHSLLEEEEEESTPPPLVLNGHNDSPVSCIRFSSPSGTRLASGGMDGCIILWDLIAESGLFRLLGHKGGITSLTYFETSGRLISTSMDSLVKCWDVERQYCMQTIANHKGEVWAGCCEGVIDKDGGEGRTRLITGSNDYRLRVWDVDLENAPVEDANQDTETTSEQNMNLTPARYMGSIHFSSANEDESHQKRVQQIQMHRDVVAVSFHNSKFVNVYSFRSHQDTERKRKRRLKRRALKAEKKEGEKKEKKKGILDEDSSSSEEEDNRLFMEDQIDPETVSARDELEYWGKIRASHKIRGFQFVSVSTKEETSSVNLILALMNNSMEIQSLSYTREDKSKIGTVITKRTSTLEMYGHSSGIRGMALNPSPTNNHLCTLSNHNIKLWSVEKRSCIRSISESEYYLLCCAFLPGGSYVVVGTKEGHLLVVDVLGSGEVVQEVEKAHEGAIWDLEVVSPDEEGVAPCLITGSSDHTVHFHDIVEEDGLPSLVQTRALQMKDEIVSLRISHDCEKRLIAVSTLDCTIKVFFFDTLQFYLSLYGHSLPVLSVDISTDDTLLISGSADKTIKIWGLDFGDTHRTLYGHSDSITQVQFVPKTHYFFSCSKDKTVRYWDADRFEQILCLDGHTAEVYALAVCHTGAFLLSGGMDRQVRVWERTKDIVFLMEEKERQLDLVLDRNDADRSTNLDEEEDRNHIQSEAAVQKSLLSIDSADRIMSALETADLETKELLQNPKKKTANPLLLGMEQPCHYIQWVLKSIKAAELEPSILVLPLNYVERLIHYLILLLRQRRGVELCSRVSILIIKSHQNEIIATHTLSTPMSELYKLIKLRLQEYRKIFGFNLVAMRQITKLAQERKSMYRLEDDSKMVDVWAGMGLGSDVAAALDRKNKGGKRKQIV